MAARLASTVLFLLSLLLSACASYRSRTQELLAQDYAVMTNDNLLLYYYQLDDQIRLVERADSRSRLSVGFGLGSFGRSRVGSAGVGVSSDLPQRSDQASTLRERRNLVRLELRRRDITP